MSGVGPVAPASHERANASLSASSSSIWRGTRVGNPAGVRPGQALTVGAAVGGSGSDADDSGAAAFAEGTDAIGCGTDSAGAGPDEVGSADEVGSSADEVGSGPDAVAAGADGVDPDSTAVSSGPGMAGVRRMFVTSSGGRDPVGTAEPTSAPHLAHVVAPGTSEDPHAADRPVRAVDHAPLL